MKKILATSVPEQAIRSIEKIAIDKQSTKKLAKRKVFTVAELDEYLASKKQNIIPTTK